MKQAILSCLCLLFISSQIIGQTHSDWLKKQDSTYRAPYLAACDDKDKRNCTRETLEDLIYANLEQPAAAVQANLEQSVYLDFVIDKEGKVKSLNESRDYGYGCLAAIKKAIGPMPEFKPATVKGEPVSSTVHCSIRFTPDKYFLAKKKRGEKIDEPVRLSASFDEGQRDFPEFYIKKMIYQNLVMPQGKRNRYLETQVVASFEFDAEGAVSNVLILDDPGGLCSEAVNASINKLPTMTPATFGGAAVASRRFQYNILFTSDQNFYKTVANFKPPVTLPPKKKIDSDAYQVVEEMPKFTNCDEESDKLKRKQCADLKMLQFIYKNVRYPLAARENGIEGTVVVRFIIAEDGTPVNAEIVRDIGYGAGEEAQRVVDLMPKWIPGKQNDEAVRVYFNLPIKFRLE